MSAFVVSHRHIDVLVETAMFGPASTRRNWHTFTYYHRKAGEPDLSAGRERTIRPGDYDAANRLGQLLLEENAASVNYRYPGDPEPPADEYQCRTATRLPAVDVLMALDGYEYQSCEHPGWRTSEARSFTDALRRAVIGHLPGYSESDCWAIPEATTTAA